MPEYSEQTQEQQLTCESAGEMNLQDIKNIAAVNPSPILVQKEMIEREVPEKLSRTPNANTKNAFATYNTVIIKGNILTIECFEGKPD